MIKVSKRPENLQTVKKETTSMPDQEGNIYRVTELVGTSRTGFDDAVRRAIERAQKTLRHVQWFEVKEQRGRILADGIEYQVTVEIGFTLES
jgi:dodecin